MQRNARGVYREHMHVPSCAASDVPRARNPLAGESSWPSTPAALDSDKNVPADYLPVDPRAFLRVHLRGNVWTRADDQGCAVWTFARRGSHGTETELLTLARTGPAADEELQFFFGARSDVERGYPPL